MRYALFTGLVALAGVNCRSTSNTYHIEDGGETVENLRRVPAGWNEIGAPSAEQKLRFRIALRSVFETNSTLSDLGLTYLGKP
jgi:tripeptidyl-peptidase I